MSQDPAVPPVPVQATSAEPLVDAVQVEFGIDCSATVTHADGSTDEDEG